MNEWVTDRNAIICMQFGLVWGRALKCSVAIADTRTFLKVVVQEELEEEDD